MTASINIDVGVKSQRQTNEPFRPTSIVVEAFHYVTDEASYLSETPGVATQVFEFLELQRASLWENSLSFHVTLENTTEVQMAKGLIPMPKGHRDGAMAGGEADSPEVIQKWLNTAIADLLQKAKY